MILPFPEETNLGDGVLLHSSKAHGEVEQDSQNGKITAYGRWRDEPTIPCALPFLLTAMNLEVLNRARVNCL